MSDSEKIKLIDRMITDFWEYNVLEDQRNGAMALVVAICSVVEIGEET